MRKLLVTGFVLFVIAKIVKKIIEVIESWCFIGQLFCWQYLFTVWFVI